MASAKCLESNFVAWCTGGSITSASLSEGAPFLFPPFIISSFMSDLFSLLMCVLLSFLSLCPMGPPANVAFFHSSPRDLHSPFFPIPEFWNAHSPTSLNYERNFFATVACIPSFFASFISYDFLFTDVPEPPLFLLRSLSCNRRSEDKKPKVRTGGGRYYPSFSTSV